jgi:GT2 family glycosyltransferase
MQDGKPMSIPCPDFPKIAIIILNWNGKTDTLACLESIQNLSYPNYETIIVDNGSTDDSVATIRRQFPKCQLIETGANLGFAGGNNVGIQQALNQAADFVFLLNNDTIVAPDILEHFIKTYREHPDAGILGAKIFLYDQRDTLDHLGGKWDSATGTFNFIGLRQKEDGKKWQHPEEIDYVCGAGLIVKRCVFETIGDLDPRFFLIWEESDFCFRARRAGFKTMTCPQAHLWHKVSASFVGGKPHSTYFWWRNRLLWIEKNCSTKEKWRLVLGVLIPDILHMLKIRLLKKAQLFLIQWFVSKDDLKEKNLKLLKNKAALCGIRDYAIRKFGNGPNWIYRKNRHL